MGRMPRPTAVLALAAALFACAGSGPARSRDARARDADELSALWSYYRYNFLEEGRAVERDEGGITTSEAQSYALLRAVWSGDRATFDEVWRWTRARLQVRRGDRLLAWRWKAGAVVDENAAADADVDVALALVLGSRRFSDPGLRRDALAILEDVWRLETVEAGGRRWPVAGNWAAAELYPTLHVGYLAPHAYQVFASVDPRHPWKELVASAYDVLHFVYLEQRLALPPEKLWVDRATGRLLLEHPKTRERAAFGYDVVPLFWRVAVDAAWWHRGEEALRERMLAPFAEAWRRERRIVDRYAVDGRPLSQVEGLPQLASIHALALVEDAPLGAELRRDKLDALFARALAGEPTPYYLHNWLWFDRAFELGAVRHLDEVLGFLRPFDWDGFRAAFPALSLAVVLALYPLARRWRPARALFLAGAFALCARYLAWRATSTLNFVEPFGLAVSGSLLLAELYSFSTVVLLLVQVGLSGGRKRREAPPPIGDGEPHPTVDVFVPIYSESLDILDRTLAAAAAMRYPAFTVHVCDDSHREEVAALAREHGARYLRGPRQHAKAGNLNQALEQTSGELVVVFDTDHIPADSFLEKTVPFFSDPRMGVVQTPHHFYNADIFQRAFGAAVPNEQDLFNHGIQAGRGGWGGAFFVGSGAVFRRAALASVGGFNLLSITEDIHTSQKLHAKGWRSAFVDEDLAVGLSAENLQSYLVQRRRWMLGCLQIMLKDNPLLQRGLTLRQRLGYFASLYYFLFPLARVAFWATPAWFLLFHLHPLFADVSELLGYLVPAMVLLPLASTALLPGWPRLLWGVVYEYLVCFPLLRAMFDLVLPKRLGFKVTPKGIVSGRRAFDFGSSKLTLAAAALMVAAVGKGFAELAWFGIEKDAYFFNLSWALANLIALGAALLVAWERPQRRGEERVALRQGATLHAAGVALPVTLTDLGLGGAGAELPAQARWPERSELAFAVHGRAFRFEARLVRCEARGRVARAGLAFGALGTTERRALVRALFARAATWAGAHDLRPRTNVGMVARLAAGLVGCFAPWRARRRRTPRRRALALLDLVFEGGAARALAIDRGVDGLGLVVLARRLPELGEVPLLGERAEPRALRVVHRRRVAPFLWRLGLAASATPAAVPTAYLAA
jgi:cellulose synthase/poly-beta-1,6-N-acetylglucosamine synthase-like glycosyltransferase/endo-1,4-beta-D-glucanase Y